MLVVDVPPRERECGRDSSPELMHKLGGGSSRGLAQLQRQDQLQSFQRYQEGRPWPETARGGLSGPALGERDPGLKFPTTWYHSPAFPLWYTRPR